MLYLEFVFVSAGLFSGRTNAIYLSREYYQEYACEFDLTYYPFDTQLCFMVFEVQGKTDNYIRLSKDEREGAGIEFLSSRDLVEYQIQMEALQFKSVNNISQGIVKFVFRHGPLENWTQHSIIIPYGPIISHCLNTFTPFFTAVYIVELSVLCTENLCTKK